MMRDANGGTREQKNQGVSRAMSKPAPSTPTPFRRGTGMSQWGYEPLRRMREEFDKMVEQFFGAWPLTDMAARPMNWSWDLQEDDTSITVRAEAPGFEPSEFDVQVRGDQLILRASHKAETEEKQPGYREWQQQEFYRSISLPQGVTDHDKVEATYRNGILTVTLPKTEQTKARHISVKGEEAGGL
jgi:HSP20 family protein